MLRPLLLLGLAMALPAAGPAVVRAATAATATADADVAAGPALVSAVIDGDTLELADGRQVRLAGVQALRPSFDGEHRRLADAATAALRDLSQGRMVTLSGAAPMDRHGRLLAQLVRDDGLWIQGALLAKGLVRVQTRPDARERAAELLAVEAQARAAGRGLWRVAAFAVRPAEPDRLYRDRDSFQIVEGQVLSAARAGGTVYLNFGVDRRTDVTVAIGGAALRAFAGAGIDPLSYQGRRIRVRGWIGLRNGPMIEASHPEQIERLDVLPGDAPAAGAEPSAEPPGASPDLASPDLASPDAAQPDEETTE